MRLNRYLAACGLGSRRGCEDLVESGRVCVNGAPAHFGVLVGAGDRVTVDGVEIHPQTSSVWMLHKPAGIVSTARDTHGRPTVLDLARQHGVVVRLFPVGRLDRDSTGLLLLTDDGDLAYRMTHPSWGVEKEYEAEIGRSLSAEELARLQQGIELEDGPTAPCTARSERRGDAIVLSLVLHEGRKRQIRRMLRALDVPLAHLHRVRVGPLRLGTLPPGALRALTPAEIAALRAALALPKDAS